MIKLMILDDILIVFLCGHAREQHSTRAVSVMLAGSWKRRKLPHIGFYLVRLPNLSFLFDGFKAAEEFYFVNLYRLLAQYLPGQKAICNYGIDFLAAYEHGNILGAQFHPEKSQTNGVKLSANFLRA